MWSFVLSTLNQMSSALSIDKLIFSSLPDYYSMCRFATWNFVLFKNTKILRSRFTRKNDEHLKIHELRQYRLLFELCEMKSWMCLSFSILWFSNLWWHFFQSWLKDYKLLFNTKHIMSHYKMKGRMNITIVIHLIKIIY